MKGPALVATACGDNDARADKYADYGGVAFELGEFAPEFDLVRFLERRGFSHALSPVRRVIETRRDCLRTEVKCP